MGIITQSSFGQSNAYVVADADEYFRSGRYFDAFFAYRTAARLPEFAGDYQIEQQIKNSSKALYLKKKYNLKMSQANYIFTVVCKALNREP